MLVNAQNSIDIFTLSGFYGTPANYQAPLDGKATESGSLLNLKVPIVLSDRTIWYNDLTYTFYSVTTDIDNEPGNMLTSMRLNAFILQTGLVQKIGEKNAFQFLLVPRYTTDFEGNDSKNWQFGMIALYEHRYNDNLLMRFGTLYNGELFGPLLVPLVYLDWRINERWQAVGLLPINLKINYKLSDRLITGFSHFGFTTTYRIGQPEFKTDYVERNSIDESLFLRYKVAGNIHLEGRFGYSIHRLYSQYAEDQKLDLRISILSFGDDRVQKNIDFDSGPIASLRLVYNVEIK